MAETRELVPAFELEIDGQVLGPALLDAVEQLEVDLSLDRASLATVILHNPRGALSELALFRLGGELIVRVGYVGKMKPVFRGDLVAVEPRFPHSADPSLVLRAYDRLHRLRRGRRRRTFLNQTLANVVQQLASDHGLSAKVDPAVSLRWDYLLQNNQTDLEFLTELARKAYSEVWVEEQTLRLAQPGYDKGPERTWTWNDDLLAFTVRTSSANVPTSASTRGWDPRKKEPVQSKTKQLHGAGLAPASSPKVTEKAFGEANHSLVARPVPSVEEAEALARRHLNEAALLSTRGEAEVLGDPSLRPGRVVELLGLGKVWSGTYYLRGVRHRVGDGYTCELQLRRTGLGAAPAAAPPPR